MHTLAKQLKTSHLERGNPKLVESKRSKINKKVFPSALKAFN